MKTVVLVVLLCEQSVQDARFGGIVGLRRGQNGGFGGIVGQQCVQDDRFGGNVGLRRGENGGIGVFIPLLGGVPQRGGVVFFDVGWEFVYLIASSCCFRAAISLSFWDNASAC